MAESETKPSRGRPAVFDMTSQECIWSSAGLVPYRLCDNAFDCTSCTFDLRMQKHHAKGARSWQELARKTASAEQRRCRHMISGYISAKYCPNNFDCASCEFDQLVEEEMLTQPLPAPEVQPVEGFNFAPQHYYNPSHAWARVEYGSQVRIGIDDFAARLFGAADGWRLPRLGDAVGPEEAQMVLIRDGREALFPCPLQGTVLAVNPQLEAKPQLANTAPYSEGWLLIIQPIKLVRNLRPLLFGEEAESWLAGEAQRLSELVHHEQDYQLAATGGAAISDIFGNVEELKWEELTRLFIDRQVLRPASKPVAQRRRGAEHRGVACAGCPASSETKGSASPLRRPRD